MKLSCICIKKLNISHVIIVKKNSQLQVHYRHMQARFIKKRLQSYIFLYFRVNNALNNRDSIDMNIFGM